MSKSLVPERGARKPSATAQPKLARGTRDISPATVKVARGTRDLTSIVPLDPPADQDDDTIVVDPDPSLTEDLALEPTPGERSHRRRGRETSDVADSEIAAAIDAR